MPEKCETRGIAGKNAYIIDADALGAKSLSNPGNVPVIYTCVNQYDLGLKKADLVEQFVAMKISTGKDNTIDPKVVRDKALNYWDALGILSSSYSLAAKLIAAERAGDYFPSVLFNTYLLEESKRAWRKPRSKQEAMDPMRLDEAHVFSFFESAASLLSDADLMAHHVQDESIALSTVGLLSRIRISKTTKLNVKPLIPAKFLEKGSKNPVFAKAYGEQLKQPKEKTQRKNAKRKATDGENSKRAKQT